MNDITPKEAIANLNHLYGMVAPDIQRSLDVAIKALERPQGDLISRDELKKAMWSLVINENDDIPVLNAIETINKAQAVEQNWRFYYDHGYAQAKRDFERPQGKWIEHSNERGSNWEYSAYECSECHTWQDDDSNYCGNCGADMKGGAE